MNTDPVPEASDYPPRFSSGRIDSYGDRLLPVCCPKHQPCLRDHNLNRPLAQSLLRELKGDDLRFVYTVGAR